jgi:transposase InsO family protein
MIAMRRQAQPEDPKQPADLVRQIDAFALDRLVSGQQGLDRMRLAARHTLHLAKYLEDKGMKQVRGAPMHPQTLGKIERWHQTLKNRILLENYFLEAEVEAAIAAFVDHYNHHRYHESTSKPHPADVYFGRGETIRIERRRIKHQIIQNRRFLYQHQAA